MIRKSTFYTVLTFCMTIVLTGCMPKMTIEQLKEQMPQRPVELDKLNAFAGSWEYEGEARMAGLEQTLKTTGTSESKWEGDGWYLVGRNVMNMAELGDSQAMEIWTYDTHSKKYRSTWVDSMGSIGTGESRFDEKTNTWHMRATSFGPWGKTTGKGKVTFTDENTMEWSWTEYAMGGLMKTMEMTGTGRRK